MADNGGFIPASPFKTGFKFKEGVHQLGTSRSQAGAAVTMNWNEAMLAQAQGWGHVEIGRRPHHQRPHLLAGRSLERKPSKDGSVAQERRRQIAHDAATAGNSSDNCPVQLNLRGSLMQQPLHLGTGAARSFGKECDDSVADDRGQGLQQPSSSARNPPTGAVATLNLRGSLARSPLQLLASSPCGAISSSGSGKDSIMELKSAEGALEHLRKAWAAQVSELRAFQSRVSSAAGRELQSNPLTLNAGVLYFGSVRGREPCPWGNGVLLLADGAQHVGHFVEGRADGRGFYFSPKGAVYCGKWVQNKRTGWFVALDAQGKLWLEEYGSDGKRQSRLPAASSKEAEFPASMQPAAHCETCGVCFHQLFDHAYACRKHPAGSQQTSADTACEVDFHALEPF